MTNPNQRFSVGLVPTLPTNPPLPDAAPAADAGERVAALEAEVERLRLGWKADAATLDAWMEKTRNLNSRVGVLKSERDEARRLARPYQQRAEDEATSAGRLAVDLCSALARAEAAEAERDRLSAELAALRGALAEMVAARDFDGDPATYSDRIMRAWAGAERALATATATPRAAGTGMGGDGWTREAQRGQSGLYWLLLSGGDRPRLLDVFWPSDGPIVAGLGAPMPGDILLWGPPFTGEPPPGWREALATAMPTPTPPAAEAGTEFGRWIGPEEERVTRLLIHAAVQECDDEYGARPSDELIDAAQQYRAWEYEQPEPDQPQEADYAR